MGSALENRRSAGRPALLRTGDYFTGSFEAMASPCSILVDTDDQAEAERAVAVAAGEAWRIERKFSRYLSSNIVDRINRSSGKAIDLDEETALLLDYAATCYHVSEGLFDITSGVLRRLWKFDGGDRVPSRSAVRDCLRYVGWGRVTWKNPTLVLPRGMEIDFGGIGKEYAVDRAASLVAECTSQSFVVNFGGDLFVSGERGGRRPWAVGVDDPEDSGGATLYRLEVKRGGIGTSGDARRFVIWKGRRLGHILNPRTGWPVEDAPPSVTVAARTCTEAGTLSTLAILHGPNARAYLEAQGVQFWM